MTQHLVGYLSAGVRYLLTPAGHPLPRTSTALRLAFRSPSTWIDWVSGASPC